MNETFRWFSKFENHLKVSFKSQFKLASVQLSWLQSQFAILFFLLFLVEEKKDLKGILMDRRCLSHFAVFFISSLRTSFLNWYTQAKYIDKNVSGLVSKDKRKREDFCQSSWKFFRYLCCSRQFLWFLWYTFFFVHYDTSITGGYSVIKKKLFLAPYHGATRSMPSNPSAEQ